MRRPVSVIGAVLATLVSLGLSVVPVASAASEFPVGWGSVGRLPATSQERSADDRAESDTGRSERHDRAGPIPVLGVDQRTHDVIREAYRALARKFHPDLAPGRCPAADGADQRRLGAIGDEQHVRSDCANGLTMAAQRDRADERRRGHSRRHRPVSTPRVVTAGSRHATWHRRSRATAGTPVRSVLRWSPLGWSLGEIARIDPGYLLWPESRPEGSPYAGEIDGILRRLGIRTSDAAPAAAAAAGFARQPDLVA
jgi:hypothetical protein